MASNGKVTMSVADWIKVEDNPRQRNTEIHAKSAVKRHLADYSPTHCHVSAAVLNKTMYKLDGHTRAFLWANGKLKKPPGGKVVVDVYKASSMDEVKELYSHFDNQYATETCTDKMFGACRECGIELTSPLLRKMKFRVAMSMADNLGHLVGAKPMDYEYTTLSRWKGELTEMDSWQLPAKIPGALIGLCMILLRHANAETKPKVRDFFELLVSDGGRKDQSSRCAVQWLTEKLGEMKSEGRMTGWDNIIQLAIFGGACFLVFLSGKMYKRQPKPVELKQLVKELA